MLHTKGTMITPGRPAQIRASCQGDSASIKAMPVSPRSPANPITAPPNRKAMPTPKLIPRA